MVLYIFDVDDTLINTKACVRAVDKQTGEVVFKAGTQVFNAPNSSEMLLGHDLKWDFCEFEDIDQLLSEPKKSAFNDLRDVTETNPTNWKPGPVYIFTARQRADMIHKWLDLNGISIPKGHILTYPRNSNDSVWRFKAKMLMECAKLHHINEVYIWEDDANNRATMEITAQKLGIKYHIMPV